MSFVTIRKALEEAKLLRYMERFEDENITDSDVEECISDPFKAGLLERVIGLPEHRNKFTDAFIKFSKKIPNFSPLKVSEIPKKPTPNFRKIPGAPDDAPVEKSAPVKSQPKIPVKPPKSDPFDSFQSAKYASDPKFSTVAIGIDLGTTYSCVSIFKDGQVVIIPNELGQRTTPSWVGFDSNGDSVVGDLAKRPTRDPETSVFDAKRLIGRKFTDPEVQQDMKVWPFKVVSSAGDTPKIQVHGKTYFAEEISARVLREMKTLAENYLGVSVKDAVVTVPAYFNNGQRQATKDAGEIAGLNILKIINEPTAAAIAYNLHEKSEVKKNVLIFDLGGGTFDVSVLTMFKGEILVKAVGGNTHLGGQDFDNEMVNHCIKIFNEKHHTDLGKVSNPANARALKRIRHECEKQKCVLSAAPRPTTKTAISLDVVYDGHDLDVSISREQFEGFEQIKAKFQQCMDIVRDVLKDANLKTGDIDEIVLVGGSTRIPKIQEMLKTMFYPKPLNKSLNPDEAVAYGAAIQASLLNGKKEDVVHIKTKVTKIQNVTPFSLGIPNGTKGEIRIFIPKNTVVPCKVVRTNWQTIEDNQTEALIEIYEGEDPVAKNNELLGKFTLSGIPPAKAGVQKLHHTMEITDENILKVSSVSVSSNSSNSITISSLQGRLSQQTIAELRLKQE